MTNLEVARLAQSTRGGPFGKRQASKQARVPDSQARQTCIRLSTPQVRQSRMQLDNPNKQAGCKVHGKASTWHTPKQWALVQNMQVVCSRPDSRQARTCPRSRKQRAAKAAGQSSPQGRTATRGCANNPTKQAGYHVRVPGRTASKATLKCEAAHMAKHSRQCKHPHKTGQFHVPGRRAIRAAVRQQSLRVLRVITATLGIPLERQVRQQVNPNPNPT